MRRDVVSCERLKVKKIIVTDIIREGEEGKIKDDFQVPGWELIEVKDYEVRLGWAEDEMKPEGGKEIGYSTYADTYWTVSFPLHFL